MDSVEGATRKSHLKWFWHVQSMKDSRLPKKLLKTVVDDSEGIGTLRMHQLDSVKRELSVRGLE